MGSRFLLGSDGNVLELQSGDVYTSLPSVLKATDL